MRDWLDLKSKGLNNMPGVPVAEASGVADTLYKLNKRKKETGPAEKGLSFPYTIGGNTASAHDFLFGDPKLRNLSLGEPMQFSISWTYYKGIFDDAVKDCQKPFADMLTSVDKATEGFWGIIADYGTPYNLLILRRVTSDTRLAELKTLFAQYWRQGWGDSSPESILREGRLYEIDFSMFESLPAWHSDNKAPRYNPATLTLLVRDKEKKGHLEPKFIRVWSKNVEPAVSLGLPSRGEVYSRGLSTDGAWLYALQAAKTSATLYGIWLGHVYHWHIVTAAMQGTMYDTISRSHPIYQLLKPQSDYLIEFDHVLLNKLPVLGEIFSQIAPPSCIGNPEAFLKLTDMFATDRQFWEDDPKTELANNGLEEEHFTRDKPWDMYPVARHLILVWDICERFVSDFVFATYPDDSHVAADKPLQSWMNAAADPGKGNLRGLFPGIPVMNNRGALRHLLTSLVYRVTVHGVSRLIQSANPELTWVANFPPCLQREDIPPNGLDLNTQELLTYLPNTGTIGEMLNFYFAFAFSKPYVPLIPPGNAKTPDGSPSRGAYGKDLYFSGGTSEPRNAALMTFRQEMEDFIRSEYKWWKKDHFSPDVQQWPRNIET